jgi:hypothetical protein
LEDNTLRERLISAGKKRIQSFRWEDAASEVLRFYEFTMER